MNLLPHRCLGILGIVILASNLSSAEELNGVVRRYQQALIDQDQTGSNAVILFRDGRRICEQSVQSGKQGDRDVNSRTVFPIWSMSKPVTIVATMLLHEQGKFDWDDEVSAYIPCLKNLRYMENGRIKNCKEPLRIIHLMTHQSGWSYPRLENEIDVGAVPDVRFDSIYPNQTRFDNLQEFVEACARQPLAFEPGTRFLYGVNQAILGRLIEVVSGQSFEGFLQQEIFKPLGMIDTGFSLNAEQRARFQPLFINTGSLKGFTYLLDEMSYRPGSRACFGGEGLVSTMEDYARFCEMLLAGGVFRGERILSEDSIATMTKKWVSGYPQEANADAELAGHYFGFSLFILDVPEKKEKNVPRGIYGWAGYHNTHFWIDPENKMFGLFMSRARPFNWGIPFGLREIVYEQFSAEDE
ncbi:MAG: beta-lactamase family protein [Planctomycetaceae bacterium]|nr:beta-lactamase family protein [Planctomycetaceae bacterium]